MAYRTRENSLPRREQKKDSDSLDTTAQVQTEDIQSAKEQLEHVIEFSPAVIYTAKLLPNLRMEVTYMSKNIASLSGFEAENFIGPRGEDFWETRVHPDDLKLYRAEVPKLKNQNHWSSEYRFLRKDGVYRWIREEFNVTRDSAGNIRDMIGLWTDITESKQTHEAEEKQRAQLTVQLYEITDHVQSLSRTREALKTAPDTVTGLNMVLDSVLWDFKLDYGAVVVLDRQTNTANVRAHKGRTKQLTLNTAYSLDCAELRALQRQSISRTVEKGEKTLFGMENILTIPILTALEIYGALVFGNESLGAIEESHMRILELYAELVYSFMMEKSVGLIPTLEPTTKPMPINLQPGEMYLVKQPAKAFEDFANAVFGGHEGLCVTRVYPPKVRDKFGLQKTPIIWLTNESIEGEQTVHSIQDLSRIIGDFLGKAQKAVVLIDGFEYLITNHGFDAFLRFLQILKNRIQLRNGLLIASISDQAVTPKELALIEREMQPFAKS